MAKTESSDVTGTKGLRKKGGMLSKILRGNVYDRSECEDLYAQNGECHYKARKFVSNLFDGIDGIAPDSDRTLKFVFQGISPLMKAVIRQVALRAHFPNYNDDAGDRGHKTTLVVAVGNISGGDYIKECVTSLSDGDCLGNLPRYCKTECRRPEGTSSLNNHVSFLDIQLEIVDLGTEEFDNVYKDVRDSIVIRCSDVESVEMGPEDSYIDTHAARLINMVYNFNSSLKIQ